ncbi:lamin tail domain-containing protein [bacterium]|nr:lamin tail domain-containing protein [bacterium]
MRKFSKIAVALLPLAFSLSASKGNAQIIISGFLSNPGGTDSPYEYTQLIATQSIDFSLTPYSVVVCNNGTASSNGWFSSTAASSVLYKFNLTAGTVNSGDVFYVGGSGKLISGSGSTDITAANWIKVINTATTGGDGYGTANGSGVFGNGGSSADGIAIFSDTTLTASTVPVDAIFYGSAVGGAKPSTGGYVLPTNDHYTNGQTFGNGTNTYLFSNPGSNQYVKLTGTFNTVGNSWNIARTSSLVTLSTTSTLADITTEISLVTTGNQPPALTGTNHSPQIPTSTDLVTVSVEATDDSPLTYAPGAVALFYDSGSGFSSLGMANTSGNTWQATIPAQANGTVVRYYVSATDNQGLVTTDPTNAPTGFYLYQVNNSGTASPLVVTEILYNDSGSYEFIEVYNNTGATVNLDYWEIGDGTSSFTIPTGTTVANGGFVIFTNNLTNFTTAHPTVTNVVGSYTFGLSSSSAGETVTLSDPNELLADQVAYQNGQNSWAATTAGFSIELVDPTFDNSFAVNWILSTVSGGHPGELTLTDTTPPGLVSVSVVSTTELDVLFNENVGILSSQNTGNYSIDNGIGTPVSATVDGSNNALVHLTLGTAITAGTYILTVSNVQDLFNNVMTSGNLSFTYVAPGSIIITEIMQNPNIVLDSNGEWFEVYNTTSAPIDLNGWTIKDNGSNIHTISGSVVVAAGSYAVLGRDGNIAANGGVTLAYVYSGIDLGNSADQIILKLGGTEIDKVEYDGGPLFPDPTGASMELTDLSADNNLASNWATAISAWSGSAGDLGSPGTTNTTSTVPTTPDPVEITITISGSDLTVSWSASTLATSYNVYRGTTPDFVTDALSLVGTTASTSYTDSGAALSSTYYYKVTAAN